MFVLVSLKKHLYVNTFENWGKAPTLPYKNLTAATHNLLLNKNVTFICHWWRSTIIAVQFFSQEYILCILMASLFKSLTAICTCTPRSLVQTQQTASLYGLLVVKGYTNYS